LLDMSKRNRGERRGAPKRPPGEEYDEDTFLYFLHVERARAERAKCPLRLLFATLEPVRGKPAPIPAESAARLFEGLRRSLRETDVIGWYKRDRVAGAVLAARAGVAGREPSVAIERRVGEDVRQCLPSAEAHSLKVRVVQLGPRQVGNSQGGPNP
jgi:hypothetical protein